MWRSELRLGDLLDVTYRSDALAGTSSDASAAARRGAQALERDAAAVGAMEDMGRLKALRRDLERKQRIHRARDKSHQPDKQHRKTKPKYGVV